MALALLVGAALGRAKTPRKPSLPDVSRCACQTHGGGRLQVHNVALVQVHVLHHPKGQVNHALLRDEFEHAAMQPTLQEARVGQLEDHRVGDLEVSQLLKAGRWQDDLVGELEDGWIALLLGGEKRDGVAAERVLERPPAEVAPTKGEHGGG